MCPTRCPCARETMAPRSPASSRSSRGMTSPAADAATGTRLLRTATEPTPREPSSIRDAPWRYWDRSLGRPPDTSAAQTRTLTMSSSGIYTRQSSWGRSAFRPSHARTGLEPRPTNPVPPGASHECPDSARFAVRPVTGVNNPGHSSSAEPSGSQRSLDLQGHRPYHPLDFDPDFSGPRISRQCITHEPDAQARATLDAALAREPGSFDAVD